MIRNQRLSIDLDLFQNCAGELEWCYYSKDRLIFPPTVMSKNPDLSIGLNRSDWEKQFTKYLQSRYVNLNLSDEEISMMYNLATISSSHYDDLKKEHGYI